MSAAFEIAELERRMDNMLRGGTVIEVDYMAEPPVAKIQDGDFKSGWIPFMATRANGQEVSWDIAEIGERVMILAPSGDPANARIIPGALYCGVSPAPAVNPDVITRMYKDGAHVTYDREAHVRTIQLPQDGELKVIVGGTTLSLKSGGVTLTTPELTVDGNTITLDGETHLGGSGGEPVARKGDAISTSTEKITEGSSDVYST